MTSKAKRHDKIISLIQENSINSQQQLTSMLEGIGIIATQATISRDLDEIGAIKVRIPNAESIYAIPEILTRPGAQSSLAKVLKTYVLSITSVDKTIVVHTPLGSADVTCAAIDSARMPEIVGTIAGQDTILIIINEETDSKEFVNKLSRLSDLPIT